MDTNALGKNVQVTTALPTSATDAQIDQWRKYAYATYLIGNNGRAYFEFVPYSKPRGSELSNPLYTLDIGSPTHTASTAAGYANGGWFERSFTKGKVLVNPTTAAVTVSLGGSYLLPNGATITSLTLGPNSGEILRLAGGSTTPPPPPPPSDGNLLSNGSFEGSTAGWAPMSSTFSLVGGTVGSQAIRVTRANYSTYGLIASPAPLTSLTAGAVYEGGGSIRSATPGKQVCLVLREKKADGALLYKTGCVTSTTSWQAFPTVRLTVAGNGSLVDYYVYQSGAVTGDSFELDGLTLRASSASTTPSANLLSNGSFEGSTSGWAGLSSTLSVVGGGTVGTLNVKVTRANYSTYGIIASPAPVTSLTAGAVYAGGGSIRSATPGKQVCLVLREKKPDGTLVYKTGCLTSTTSWQALPTVTHTAAANGSLLDFYVYQSGAVTGDTFELDGLTLTRR
jgi:hypothetical protein